MRTRSEEWSWSYQWSWSYSLAPLMVDRSSVASMIHRMKLVRVHLKRNIRDATIDPDIAREAVLSIAKFACNGGVGWQKGDVVFERVTEGRQACWLSNGVQVCYSSCGDLAQFVLWLAAGAERYEDPAIRRMMRYTNRKEAWGWKVGWNIAAIDGYAMVKNRHRPGDTLAAGPGYLLLIGENGKEHIAVVNDVNGSTLTTYDYGQFFGGKPGGKRCTRTIRKGADGRLWCWATEPPGRPVVWTVNPGGVLKLVSGAGPIQSALVPEDFHGGIRDDNPYASDYL